MIVIKMKYRGTVAFHWPQENSIISTHEPTRLRFLNWRRMQKIWSIFKDNHDFAKPNMSSRTANHQKSQYPVISSVRPSLCRSFLNTLSHIFLGWPLPHVPSTIKAVFIPMHHMTKPMESSLLHITHLMLLISILSLKSFTLHHICTVIPSTQWNISASSLFEPSHIFSSHKSCFTAV